MVEAEGILVDESRFDLGLCQVKHSARQHPQRCLAFFIGIEKKKIPPNSFYLTEVEKNRKTTVTLKEHSSGKKITQVTINLNSLSYLANQRHKPHQTENSQLKESPTQQVVRLLIKYRSNFPSSKHTILVAAFLATKGVGGGRRVWSSCVGKEGKRERRKPNLLVHSSPCSPSLGNHHPTIVTNYLFSTGMS